MLLYRYCSKKEYKSLKINGFIKPLYRDYISLSSDISSFDKCTFHLNSDYLLTFDGDELEKQGLIHIQYDYEWLKNQPESIITHITETKSLHHFQRLCRKYDETPQQAINLYSWENECIISEIVIKNDVLVNVKSLSSEQKLIMDAVTKGFFDNNFFNSKNYIKYKTQILEEGLL